MFRTRHPSKEIFMKIRWTNKWSKEQGYVRCINKKGGYFENTFNIEEAKNFPAKSVSITLRWLDKHEPDNTYDTIE